MLRKFLLLFLIILALPASSQKALKSVKASLKANKQTDALKEIAKLEKDSTINGDPRLYSLGVQAHIALNNTQNEKAYLKQKYDTAQFFNSTYGVYEYALKTDSAERILLAKKGTKMKFQKTHVEYLHKYYKNLCAGGRYFYIKKNFAEATKFLKMALVAPTDSMWGDNKDIINKKAYVENATLLLYSAYKVKDYQLAIKYSDLALKDTTVNRAAMLETQARIYKAVGDTANFLRFIRLGLKEYAKVPFFFTEMTDYYTAREDYSHSLQLADSLLPADSTNLYFLSAKSLALMNLNRDKESIEVSKRILELDSTQAEIYYYTGAAYCNLAEGISLPTNINSRTYKKANSERVAYYKSALPYLEKYRQLKAENKKKWAPLLYDIYLALNKGDKFEEMQTLMNEIFPAGKVTE